MTDSDTAPSAAEPEASPLPAAMTPEQLEEAKRYGRIGFACDLLDQTIDLVYLSLASLLLALPLDRWLRGVDWLAGQAGYLRWGVLYLIVTGLHFVVSFPLSYYTGYVIEHRFGLSRQTLARWLGRHLLSMSLTLGFGLLMYEGLYLILQTTGPYWWLVATGAFLIVAVIFGQLMPILILPLFYKVERLDDQRLYAILSADAAGAGLSITGIFRILLGRETVKANAMLTGLGRTRRVLLGDTLLEGFTAEEIRVVFAHELGHHVWRHIPKTIALITLYSCAGFYLCSVVVPLVARWLDPAVTAAAAGGIPVFAQPLLTLCLALFGWILTPLHNTLSRHFERQSDAYALRVTGDAASFRGAFEKLARQNKADPEPHWLDVVLNHSHPPIVRRLEMAGGEEGRSQKSGVRSQNGGGVGV